MNISNPLVKVADRITALEAGVPAVDLDAIAEIVKGGLAKADVGLSAVDNTSDVDKPVSTAQAAAINNVNFIASRKGPLSMLGEVIVNRDIIDGIESFTITESDPVTSYLQEAIDDCLPRRGRVSLGVGLYRTGPLTINPDSNRGSVEIVGESWDGDIGQPQRGGASLRALTASNAPMFTVGINAGTNLFENLNIQGQRDLQNQSSDQYAIDFTAEVGGQRRRAARMKDLLVTDFLKGIRIGTGRNAGVMDHVTILAIGGRIFGTAQAVTSTTITLANTASAVNGAYVGMPVIITGSTGQALAVQMKRDITAYDGATKIATVDSAWDILPSGTVTYRVNTVEADALQIGSTNDWRVDSCDIGNATRYGIYCTGAGSLDLFGTNSFANDRSGLRVDGSGMDMRWHGGSIDTNKEHGAIFVGSQASQGFVFSRAVHNAMFRQNGLGKHNTFSDVKIVDDFGVQITSPQLTPGTVAGSGTRRQKYFIEFGSSAAGTKTIVSNPRYDKPREKMFNTGTAQAGATASITLASGASASNSRYDNASIYIAGGTGAGQTRVIASYVGSTRIATVDLDWTTPPDNTSTYEVSAQAIYATAFTDKPAFLRGFTDEGVFQTTVSCAVPGDLSIAGGALWMSTTPGHRKTA